MFTKDSAKSFWVSSSGMRARTKSVKGVGEGALTGACCTIAISVEERVGTGLLEREFVALFHRVVNIMPGVQLDGQRDNNGEILTQQT